MKMIVIRTIVATLMLVASGSTPVLADGQEPLPPFCYPGTICP